MCEEKGLDPIVADKIGDYVKYKGWCYSLYLNYTILTNNYTGGAELLEKLLADADLTANPSAKTGLSEMGILFKLLKAYKVIDKVNNRLMIVYLAIITKSIS